jgi:hypothetical protein
MKNYFLKLQKEDHKKGVSMKNPHRSSWVGIWAGWGLGGYEKCRT